MIDFTFEQINTFELDKNLIANWLSNVALSENKNIETISVIFCSDDYLLSVNKEYLNHDYYTDIITFDYSVDTEISGDLFISIDRVKENATEFNVPFLNELHRVLVHGVLHLCGYGDKSPDEETLMRSKEDFYLLSI
jgi:probable rRNA maturation factor